MQATCGIVCAKWITSLSTHIIQIWLFLIYHWSKWGSPQPIRTMEVPWRRPYHSAGALPPSQEQLGMNNKCYSCQCHSHGRKYFFCKRQLNICLNVTPDKLPFAQLKHHKAGQLIVKNKYNTSKYGWNFPFTPLRPETGHHIQHVTGRLASL